MDYRIVFDIDKYSEYSPKLSIKISLVKFLNYACNKLAEGIIVYVAVHIILRTGIMLAEDI